VKAFRAPVSARKGKLRISEFGFKISTPTAPGIADIANNADIAQ
jgi:hypothetical protein